MKTKKCRTCKEELPLTCEYFRDDGRTMDGFSSHCNSCKPITNIYYLEHRTQLKNKQLKWNEENRDYKNEYNRKYKEEKWNTVRGWDKQWEEENLEHRKKYKSNFIQENLEYFRNYNNKRRLEKTHDFGNTEWERCKAYFNNQCAYCGTSQEEHMSKYGQDLHKEHADPSGSNGIENCVPSCRNCNSSKKNKHFSVWYTEDKEFYKRECIDKIHDWIIINSKIITQI